MPLSKSPQPLLDLAVASVPESSDLNPDDITSLRAILNRFIHGLIPYPEAAANVTMLLNSTEPVDLIDRILRIPPNPIPTLLVPARGSIIGRRARSRLWSPYEDQRLIAGLHRLGSGDWLAISRFVGNGRSKAQCYQRWTRGLDPCITKTKWSPDEDDHLISLVTVHGDRSWSRISSEMRDRCDVQCRYRFKQLVKDVRFAEMVARVGQRRGEPKCSGPCAPPVQITQLISRPVPQLKNSPPVQIGPISRGAVQPTRMIPPLGSAAVGQQDGGCPLAPDLSSVWSLPELLQRK
jgi:hypothetical protein